MNTIEINTTADMLDVRDICERVEDLRDEREMLQANCNDAESGPEADYAAAVEALVTFEADEGKELHTLEGLLASLKGYGGDHQWEGDWYPVTLIHDLYFVEAMKELCEDIGELPKGFPAYMVIDWDATAENLQVDYSSVEVSGQTYWYR